MTPTTALTGLLSSSEPQITRLSAPPRPCQHRPGPVNWLLPLFAVVMCFALPPPALAQSPPDGSEPCLVCHINPDITLKFRDRSVVSGRINADAFHGTAHAQEGLTCQDCHQNYDDYPHPKIKAKDRRAYTLANNAACLPCHTEQAERHQDSNHALALAEGNRNAPVCVDCHDAHLTRALQSDRQQAVQACRQCHAQIFEDYSLSVHGRALLAENNPDVPTCTGCHGVHSMADPHTNRFRLQSPQLCATCHADAGLMAPYGISTAVFETYVADFHGTTATLFQRQSPDAPANTAVCADCHGVHSIPPMDSPQAVAASKENLLKRCQQCHPDATPNFSDSWLGHFPPTFSRQPLVAAVSLFYRLLIPGVIGLMGLFVAADATRRVLNRVRPPGQEDA